MSVISKVFVVLFRRVVVYAGIVFKITVVGIIPGHRCVDYINDFEYPKGCFVYRKRHYILNQRLNYY